MKLDELITKKEFAELQSGLLRKLNNTGSPSEKLAINNLKKLANTNKKMVFKNKKLSKLPADESLTDVLGVLSKEFINDAPGKLSPVRLTLFRLDVNGVSTAPHSLAKEAEVDFVYKALEFAASVSRIL